jgi:hypothetical protein
LIEWEGESVDKGNFQYLFRGTPSTLCRQPQETTAFSRAELQLLREIVKPMPARHHRLQPRGASTSSLNSEANASQTPQASASWSFNFFAKHEADASQTPQASASWSFNFFATEIAKVMQQNKGATSSSNIGFLFIDPVSEEVETPRG